MSFIAGPRQIGKTTLLKEYLKFEGHEDLYFNWDVLAIRRAYRQNADFFIPPMLSWPQKELLPVVFDELHKYPKWKSHLKGLFDTWKGRVRFIVTGSARLDFMRKSGDSLVGRYFLFRKLPLHPREMIRILAPSSLWLPGQPFDSFARPSSAFREAAQQLFELNGFPEPLFTGSKAFLQRWQTEHLTLLVTEDLADLTKIEKILRVEELAELLPNRVGSPLNIQSVARDLEANFPSIKRWLEALELVYLIFRIPPYSRKLARAIRKEQKLYFWDWSLVNELGARFENMLAVYLARAVSSWNERGLGKYELHYVRTRDGIEVDFLITQAGKPMMLIEAKLSDDQVPSSLLQMKDKLAVPQALVVTQKPDIFRMHREPGVWSVSIERFLSWLP